MLKKTGLVLINAIAIAAAIVCVFPIIWMIYSSLKTEAEFMLSSISLPAVPQFVNYPNAVKLANIPLYMLNSLLYSAVSIFFILTIGMMTGYCLSRYRFKGRRAVYLLFLSAMLVPIHGLLVPSFIWFHRLRLIDTRFVLILPYTTFGLPLTIFLIESFMRNIPTEMEEAAVMDGSTPFRTLFRIIMPICRPVIVTSLILNFLYTWNEFAFSMILLKKEEYRTVSIGIASFKGMYNTENVLRISALVMATLPVLLLYMVFRNRIIEGMAIGALKG